MRRIWIPQIIAVIMLLWAINSPFDDEYSILLHWICCPVFAFLAVQAFKEKQQGWIWIFGTAACAYNPIIPPDITRHLWISFHFLAIAVSGLSVFYMKTNTNLEKTS